MALDGTDCTLSRAAVIDSLCGVKITFSDNIPSFPLGGSGWVVAVFFQGFAFFSNLSKYYLDYYFCLF